jgi:hypothetical protein
MNYRDTTSPIDHLDFPLWPAVSAFGEEEVAAWAQAGGYAQPGPVEGIQTDTLDATLAWGQSGTTWTAEAYDFQNVSVSIFAFGTWQN